jgi:hypothetical protein
LDKHLNIVTFDNPYPPNYGGVIDVYFKIKSLAAIGIKIHLHFFTKHNNDIEMLHQICDEVFIYKRKNGLAQQLSTNPYIVQSRNSDELKANLNKNNYPILFEGLHTTKLITEDKSICNRSIIRHHNIEHDYYFGLYKSTNNILHKLYYFIESRKLKTYLNKVKDAAFHLAISNADAKKLSSAGFDNITTIPPFHSATFNSASTSNYNQDKAPYVLYHGNLNVSENIAAVDYLINDVFTDNTIKYIIAGSSNGHNLNYKSTNNIRFIKNPSFEEITDLIANARVIALPTFQATGIKLKLIDSLYKGQHVIVNEAMIEGFPMPELTFLAKNTNEMKKLISDNLKNVFTSEQRNKRIQELNLYFDNEVNATRIIEIIEKLSG